MKTISKHLICTLLLVLTASSCHRQTFRFADRAPVREINDRRPIPMPEATRFIRMEYYYKVLIRRPATAVMRCDAAERSMDVNSRDHVPASSWYTPRLGYRDITPADLLCGNRKIGPPQAPIRVVRAKSLGDNPGFIIADSRDHLYLVKFDPPRFPGAETTTAYIVNRLFWGFGYNVPEDYIFYFNSNEVPIDTTADISDEEVKLVFSSVAPPRDGIYRSTASLLLDGVYLGPIADSGVRRDDPNDHFPHENRRVLRALQVFGGFTNQTDIRIDNSLDVYIGRPGKGYVKHYLLDFGEALGAHGTERGRLWDGYSHVFSFGEVLTNFFTLGLKSRPWENIRYTPWPSVAAFEARYYRPHRWKENYPFKPIRQSQPDDNYWAAKIVSALTREHIAALVRQANYPQPAAAEYVIETLMHRRRKVIDDFFSLVSPVEYDTLGNDTLRLLDYGLRYMSNPGEAAYEVYLTTAGKEKIMALPVARADDGAITLSLDNLAEPHFTGQYALIDVRVRRNGIPAPRSAEFHLRRSRGTGWRLVGVVH